jgi:hypothetical protein
MPPGAGGLGAPACGARAGPCPSSAGARWVCSGGGTGSARRCAAPLRGGPLAGPCCQLAPSGEGCCITLATSVTVFIMKNTPGGLRSPNLARRERGSSATVYRQPSNSVAEVRPSTPSPRAVGCLPESVQAEAGPGP